MKSDVIAKRYATALFDLGREEGTEKQYGEELELVAQVVDGTPEFRAIMESPLHDINLKKKILDEVSGRMSLSSHLVSFLKILLDKDRFTCVSDILHTYEELLDREAGRIRAHIVSASELDAQETQRIAEVLSTLMKKEVAVEISVDPTLIGGVVAEVEGMVYDGSVRTQISKVKQSLKGEI